MGGLAAQRHVSRRRLSRQEVPSKWTNGLSITPAGLTTVTGTGCAFVDSCPLWNVKNDRIAGLQQYPGDVWSCCDLHNT